MTAKTKGTVTLVFEDGAERSWPDSYLIHEGGGTRRGPGENGLRVVVHEGNFVRASFRSDQVRSAVLTLDDEEQGS